MIQGSRTNHNLPEVTCPSVPHTLIGTSRMVVSVHGPCDSKLPADSDLGGKKSLESTEGQEGHS